MSDEHLEIKLNIHPSEGIMQLHKLHLLRSPPQFRRICITILREEINHNLLSVLCCNPKYVFLPLIPVSLLLGLFAFLFSWILAATLLTLVPFALLMTWGGLFFRKWVVRRCIRRAQQKIAKYTKGTISCRFRFKFFSDDESDGGNLTSFGNYVQVTADPKALAEHLARNGGFYEAEALEAG